MIHNSLWIVLNESSYHLVCLLYLIAESFNLGLEMFHCTLCLAPWGPCRSAVLVYDNSLVSEHELSRCVAHPVCL